MGTSCHGERFGAVENSEVTCQLTEAGPIRPLSTLCAPHSSSKLEDARVITTIGHLRITFARMVAR